MQSNRDQEIGFYSKNLDGHRAAYIEFAIKHLGGQRIIFNRIFTHTGPVMFLMVEENFFLYFCSCIWRSLNGLRTVGLLFRPRPAIEAKTLKLRIKRQCLQLLRLLKNVKTFSIVPTYLDYRIEKITNDWIHDFQFWDLSDKQYSLFISIKNNEHQNTTQFLEVLKFTRKVELFASGKPILIALGIQTKDKGIEVLASNMQIFSKAGWAIVVAGRFADDQKENRGLIEESGGLVIDRILSDDEMIASYALATAVWCYYDPAYDQSSGILGRAIQLGVLPIVRPGSLSEAFCKMEEVDHIACDRFDQLGISISSGLEYKFLTNRNFTKKLKDINMQKLIESFGLRKGR